MPRWTGRLRHTSSALTTCFRSTTSVSLGWTRALLSAESDHEQPSGYGTLLSACCPASHQAPACRPSATVGSSRSSAQPRRRRKSQPEDRNRGPDRCDRHARAPRSPLGTRRSRRNARVVSAVVTDASEMRPDRPAAVKERPGRSRSRTEPTPLDKLESPCNPVRPVGLGPPRPGSASPVEAAHAPRQIAISTQSGR